MIFGQFTGVAHHKKCVTFVASVVAHEDISSFEWVFKTFLKAMGHNEPVCLITDQDLAMKVVVRNIEPAEFEEKWNKVISQFHLNNHEWLAHMYNIRDMWIPAFECALDAQRHTKNKMDNDSKNKRPECKTPIPLEKDASELFTTTIFYEFQHEIEIRCFNFGVEEIKKDNELYIFREGSRRRTFDVAFDPTTLETKCFCKMFEREDIPCRHMIWVWKTRMLEKIPKAYVLSRWTTIACKKPIFDVEGNVLDECINAVDKKMLLNDLWSEIHACVSLVQNNEDDLIDLVNKLHALRMDLEHKKTTNNKGTGVHVPNQVNVPNDVHVPNEVHVPNDIHIPNNDKRMKSDREKAVEQNGVGGLYHTPEVVGSFSPGGTTKEWIPSVPEELKPIVGMIFKDPDEGLSLYKAYANVAGFAPRKSTITRKKKNKDVVAFQYGVCNKQGFKAIRKPIAQEAPNEEGKVRITRKRYFKV
ncbi:protein FAR1-RELATED SEQUENCE 5-like [Chenopodium quinoa]|uniref:protein FAR1-RELATED SEQUENCE 5-like n=1 Tax=Chenopodium quinoa TaxID=63459 RepID=UPI000B7855D1|nr:protein FAR1-RELATED SEQUENCE 5-like [Chenopodium quinoa]